MKALLRRVALSMQCSTSYPPCSPLCSMHAQNMQRRRRPRRELQPVHSLLSGGRGVHSKTAVQARRGSYAMRELQQTRQDAQEAAADAGTPTASHIEWDSPLKIVLYPDPRLRAVNASVGVFNEDLRRLAEEMFHVMYHGAEDQGVGLAAPQVGVNLRLMVFNPDGVPNSPRERVLVNPKIISVNKTRDLFEEGCLSFPRVYANIERPTRVKVKAQDLEGASSTFSLEGFAARVFQHEFDHLQGTLFHDRMEREELARVHAELVALEEGFVLANPSAPLQRVPAM